MHTGQVFTLDVPEPAEAVPQPEALPLRILYQDEDLVVLDKPAGMVVHPGAGHSSSMEEPQPVPSAIDAFL